MALHIIIDGYNLIRQSRELAAIDRYDMQAGREKLLEKLAAYRRVKPYRITVVFDGSYSKGLYPRRDIYKGITIIYSSGTDTADDVIKSLAEKEPRALVVSSDKSVAAYSELHGASSISSQDFEMRLEMTVAFGTDAPDQETDETGWDGTTSKKGPARRKPKAKRRQQNIFKKL